MIDAVLRLRGPGAKCGRDGHSNFLRKLDQTDEAITFTPLRRTRVLRSAARVGFLR